MSLYSKRGNMYGTIKYIKYGNELVEGAIKTDDGKTYYFSAAFIREVLDVGDEVIFELNKDWHALGVRRSLLAA